LYILPYVSTPDPITSTVFFSVTAGTDDERTVKGGKEENSNRLRGYLMATTLGLQSLEQMAPAASANEVTVLVDDHSSAEVFRNVLASHVAPRDENETLWAHFLRGAQR
jgi:hypothetical protein